MFASVYLTFLLSQVAPEEALTALGPANRLKVNDSGAVLELAWADAEHRLRGSTSSALPRVGEALNVSLSVGTIDGPEFSGPITVTLRPVQALLDKSKALRIESLEGHDPGAVVTVQRGEGGLWTTTVTPRQEGPHVLEIAFRGGRSKVVGAIVTVQPSRLPPWVPWVFGAALVVVSVAVGLSWVFRGDRSAPV